MKKWNGWGYWDQPRESWLKRNASRIVGIQLAVIAIATLAAGAFFWGRFLVQSGTLGAARDVAVAEYAYLRAGPPIPVDRTVVDYTNGTPLPKDDTWGVETNSQWLADIVRRIVPYYYYDNISRPAVYPALIFFTPMPDAQNFHLLGEQTSGMSDFGFYGPVIQLNERMVTGDGTDMRVLLSTVVHENIHGQGGAFTFSGRCPDPIVTAEDLKCWQEESNALESNTQTATLEVLASYCNHQNDLACKTFWFEVKEAASGSFETWTWAHHIGWFYNLVDKALWLNSGQRSQYDAAMRYWANNDPEGLKEIVTKYDAMVWDKVLRCAVWNHWFNTGNPDASRPALGEMVTPDGTQNLYPPLFMSFDDIRYQFGPLLILWLRILSL